MKALIRLYPRAWRARYGEELAMLLSDQRPSLRLAVDLLAGAVDAHLNPQPAGQTAGTKGETAMSKLLAHCRPQEVTQAEYRTSAVVMIGGTLMLAGIYIALKRAFGDNAVVDAFGVSMFPIAVILSSWRTYFKPYSSQARVVLAGLMIGLVFLISLVASLVAEKI